MRQEWLLLWAYWVRTAYWARAIRVREMALQQQRLQHTEKTSCCLSRDNVPFDANKRPLLLRLLAVTIRLVRWSTFSEVFSEARICGALQSLKLLPQSIVFVLNSHFSSSCLTPLSYSTSNQSFLLPLILDSCRTMFTLCGLVECFAYVNDA